MKVSILIPSRNNAPYLQAAYDSIRKYQGEHFVEILVLDDISDKDDTWKWCEMTIEVDPNFKAFQNKRKERLGISSGYKFLAQQATREIICHWHADMIMTEGTLDAVERELFVDNFWAETVLDDPNQSKLKQLDKVVCLTRIEPPIYNKPGVYPEKIIWADAPIELTKWEEEKFVQYIPKAVNLWKGKTTGGHFAPFFMFRDEYNRLGGNDIDNFPKQAREDSDFAFRLVLDGFKTIQIPHFVYHFASRGNRRSEHESGNFTDNPEWQAIEQKSVRNFIRKWGTMKLHNDDLTPIKPVKYNIGFEFDRNPSTLLKILEPWCSKIFIYKSPEIKYLKQDYIWSEQKNTKIDLKKKILLGSSDNCEIMVSINSNRFLQDDFTTIQNLSEIITESGEIGKFELGNLKITINAMNHYENDLIVCKNEPISLED